MDAKNNKKRSIAFMIIYILIAVLVITGVTYAFFNAFIKNNNKDKDSVGVKSGKIELTYEDDTELLKIEHLKPNMEVGTKTFTVTNTGKSKIDDYEVILSDVLNELEYYEDLTYTLTCSSDKSTCVGSNGYFPTSDDIIARNSISVGETQTFTLSIFYKETYKDQSNDLDKTITAKVNIQDETHMGE